MSLRGDARVEGFLSWKLSQFVKVLSNKLHTSATITTKKMLYVDFKYALPPYIHVRSVT